MFRSTLQGLVLYYAVTDAMTAVERQGTRLLGKEFQLDDQVDYQFALTLASELNDQDDIETFFYERLDEVSTELRRYQISVSGKPIGAVQDEAVLKQLLEDPARLLLGV